MWVLGLGRFVFSDKKLGAEAFGAAGNQGTRSTTDFFMCIHMNLYLKLYLQLYLYLYLNLRGCMWEICILHLQLYLYLYLKVGQVDFFCISDLQCSQMWNCLEHSRSQYCDLVALVMIRLTIVINHDHHDDL